MAKQRDTAEGLVQRPTEDREGGLLRHLVLLALPVLSFHRDMLPSIKKVLEENKKENASTVANFIALELHALMMILDPKHELRKHLGDSFEEDVRTKLAEFAENATDGAITIVDLQDKFIPALIETLQGKRDRKRAP